MRKLGLSIVLLSSCFGLTAWADNATKSEDTLTPYLGCYSKTQVEKILNDGEYVTLYRAKGPDGRVNELWINGHGITATVVFKDPKNGDHTNIKDVCVTNVTKNTVYNSALLDAMTKNNSNGSTL